MRRAASSTPTLTVRPSADRIGLCDRVLHPSEFQLRRSHSLPAQHALPSQRRRQFQWRRRLDAATRLPRCQRRTGRGGGHVRRAGRCGAQHAGAGAAAVSGRETTGRDGGGSGGWTARRRTTQTLERSQQGQARRQMPRTLRCCADHRERSEECVSMASGSSFAIVPPCRVECLRPSFPPSERVDLPQQIPVLDAWTVRGHI